MARNHVSFVERPSILKTPSNGAFSSTVPVHITPVELYTETEREPDTPYKEPSMKKKTGNHLSKRKLFLQGGQNVKVNKAAKRQATTSQSKTSVPYKKVHTPGSPPHQADTTKVHHPLTERQQLQYLLEVTAKEAKNDSGSGSSDDPTVSANKTKKRDLSKDGQGEARIRKRNERGETALHVAAIRGDMEDLVTLLRAGALVNAKDNAGWTPLHEACNYGNLRIVQELVWSGADVNNPGYEAITPLHDAVINDHVKVVQFLLNNGADPSLQTSQNYNASDLARSAAVLNLLRPDAIREEVSCIKENPSLVMPPVFTQPQCYEPYFAITEQSSDDTVNNVDQERFHSVSRGNESSLLGIAHRSSEDMGVSPWANSETKSCNHRDKQEEMLRSQTVFTIHENHYQLPTETHCSRIQAQSTSVPYTEITVKDDVRLRQGSNVHENHHQLPSETHRNRIQAQSTNKSYAETAVKDNGRLRQESNVQEFGQYNGEGVSSLQTDGPMQAVNGTKESAAENSGQSCVSENDDNVLPEKLNECLDKALIQISSYLENSQKLQVMCYQKTPNKLNEDSGMCNGVDMQERCSSSVVESSQKADSSKSGASSGGYNEYPSHAGQPLPTAMDGKTELSNESLGNGMVEEQGGGEQPNANFTRIKTRYESKRKANNAFQIEKSNKLGRRKKLSSRTSESSKSESSDPLVKEECATHIANRTWRADLPKYRYSMSSVRLCLPGYEDFQINNKSCSLAESTPSTEESCPGDEDQLKRLQSQHDTEKMKLRMALEQELVRVFGNCARLSVGYRVPYSACTVIGSQMRLQETGIIHVEQEDHLSIKREVDKILNKFSKLKVKLMTRQKHEVEAVLALGKLWSNNPDINGTSDLLTSKRVDNCSNYGEDFELLPSKFAEYYEEVLCATD